MCNQLHILEPQIRSYLEENKYKSEFISIIECTSRAIQKLPAASSNLRPRTFILGTKPVMDVGHPASVSPYSSVDNLVQVPEKLRVKLQELIINVKARGPVDSNKLEMQSILDELIIDTVLSGLEAGPVVLLLDSLLLDSFPAESERLSEKHGDSSRGISFHLLDPSLELAKACLDNTHE